MAANTTSKTETPREQRVVFASRYGNYIKWVGDKKAEFNAARYTATDPEIIAALKKDPNVTEIKK